MIWTRINW